jgi:hypothetical protein
MTTIIIWVLASLLAGAIYSVINLSRYANDADKEIKEYKDTYIVMKSAQNTMRSSLDKSKAIITELENKIKSLESDIRAQNFLIEMQEALDIEILNENANLNYELQMIKAVKNHKKRPVKPE